MCNRAGARLPWGLFPTGMSSSSGLITVQYLVEGTKKNTLQPLTVDSKVIIILGGLVRLRNTPGRSFSLASLLLTADQRERKKKEWFSCSETPGFSLSLL